MSTYTVYVRCKFAGSSCGAIIAQGLAWDQAQRVKRETPKPKWCSTIGAFTEACSRCHRSPWQLGLCACPEADTATH
ncbi:hypothetical protein AB0C65_38535 [Nocardia sp. NPDC048505]|uniref:hypothetical protein n=1 Tax=Nocardia sp. NPDC048505 TaxID=3155756 RepID=UPI00340D1189